MTSPTYILQRIAATVPLIGAADGDPRCRFCGVAATGQISEYWAIPHDSGCPWVMSKEFLDKPPEPAKRKKFIHVGAPACFSLELACQHLQRAFCGDSGGMYVVGSALERPDWRDVDVRLIMDDEDFHKLFPHVHDGGHWEFDARWLVMTVAISKWLTEQTGLPVDFQFQPRTHANDRHKGPRNGVGRWFAPKGNDT